MAYVFSMADVGLSTVLLSVIDQKEVRLSDFFKQCKKSLRGTFSYLVIYGPLFYFMVLPLLVDQFVSLFVRLLPNEGLGDLNLVVPNKIVSIIGSLPQLVLYRLSYYLGPTIASVIVIAFLIALILYILISRLFLQWTSFLIVDKNAGALSSVKESFQLVKKYILPLILLDIFLGLLSKGLGLSFVLFVFPLNLIINAYIYRYAIKNQQSEQ